jgi:hypothetical protein
MQRHWMTCTRVEMPDIAMAITEAVNRLHPNRPGGHA